MKIKAGAYPECADWTQWISFVKGPSINLVFLHRLAAYVRDIVKARVNVSGFRTYAEQQAAYADYLAGGNLAAKPGQSWHEYGLAVDVQRISTVNGAGVYPGTLNKDYDLFAAGKPETLMQYGLCHTVRNEPWHIQPIETKGYTGAKADFADPDDILNGGDIMLTPGDKGTAVLYWQQSLVKAGFKLMSAAGLEAAPNSNFGPATTEATKKFQSSVGLNATGMVDSNTFAYMCRKLSEITAIDPAMKAELDKARIEIAGLRVDLNNQKSLVTQASETLAAEKARSQKLRDALGIIKSF